MSTDHDRLASVGIVHNPEPVFGPGNGNIQTFELSKQQCQGSDVRKMTRALTSWINGAYFESDILCCSSEIKWRQ
jgi:hypothetical protein